jgi:hypothetical protein
MAEPDSSRELKGAATGCLRSRSEILFFWQE